MMEVGGFLFVNICEQCLQEGGGKYYCL
jgi:hypothetical protein